MIFAGVCHAGGMVSHAMMNLAAVSQQVDAASFLTTIKNAVLGFLLIVLLIGVLIGFFIGRAFGRRR